MFENMCPIKILIKTDRAISLYMQADQRAAGLPGL